jgi:hypothetical protein
MDRMVEAGGTTGRGGGGGEASREARRARARAMQGRMRRCRALPRPDDAEVARLVAEFRARGGAVTRCPPACVLPVRNGDGLTAAGPVAAAAAPGCPPPTSRAGDEQG